MGNGGIGDSNKDCKLLQAATIRTNGGVEIKYKWPVFQFVEH